LQDSKDEEAGLFPKNRENIPSHSAT